MRSQDDGHDWLSTEYVDDWVADWSAREERAGQLRRVAVALPFARDDEIVVLDLGSGWGPLSEAVLSYRRRARVTLLDFSPPMLDHARSRLAPYLDRCRYEERDFREPDWWQGLGGPFDAVVSSLAIHNLADPQFITRVYADVVRLLRPRGCFFNLELVLPAGPVLEAVDRRIRADAAGLDPDTVETEAFGHDDPRSLSNQIDWLWTAGYREVDCLWREGSMALLCGAT